jgi:hypothetical protein
MEPCQTNMNNAVQAFYASQVGVEPSAIRVLHSKMGAWTEMVGDNHGMFHQVAPIGPFDGGTRLITPSAELAPATDGTGDWVVTDHGELQFRAPLETFRVSVLWKADTKWYQRLQLHFSIGQAF